MKTVFANIDHVSDPNFSVCMFCEMCLSPSRVRIGKNKEIDTRLHSAIEENTQCINFIIMKKNQKIYFLKSFMANRIGVNRDG